MIEREPGEPSISDVLSSIRQAVEGDGQKAKGDSGHTPDMRDDVLELTDALDDVVPTEHQNVHHLPKNPLSGPADQSDLAENSFAVQDAADQNDVPVAPFSSLSTAREPLEHLVSEATAASITATLNTLKHVYAAPESLDGADADDISHDVAQALGLSVQALLRPMLKTWLDQNLPIIVRDLVSEEIKRLR